MALQIWETFKEAMSAYSDLSPAAFFAVLTLLWTIYYVLTGLFGSPRDHYLRTRASEEQMERLPPSVQVKAKLSEIIEGELKQYDGSESDDVPQSSRASSSSTSHQSSCQVFLSFRGEDTRHNFTSHLEKALRGRGIEVFLDEENLEKGEQLSQALLNAITASKISIIVLSENYAYSKFCLAELSKIMECQQIVLPIFYKVEPRAVRRPIKSFKEAFDQHLKEKPVQEVHRWEEALEQVGKIKGWHIEGGNFDR